MTFIESLPVLGFILITYMTSKWLFRAGEYISLINIDKHGGNEVISIFPVFAGLMLWGCYVFAGLVYVTWYFGEYILDPLSFPRVTLAMFKLGMLNI